jgi:hypothetical protein
MGIFDIHVKVFNATFNNISSDIFCILVEEMGVLVEKHRPVTSHFGIGKHINTTHKLNDIIKPKMTKNSF